MQGINKEGSDGPAFALSGYGAARGEKIMGKLEILAEFGFERDPFRGTYLDTTDALRIKRVLKMAVESRAMVAITGDRGLGKTEAVNLAMKEMELAPVRVMAADKEWVGIGDIERALILDLSQESARRTREIRARQLRRVLGEASRQREVVLLLEESHRIHGQTLRSLKSLREMEWMGRSPLFSVVMLAQYDPFREQRGIDEVRLRTDSVSMKGLTAGEVREYVEGTVGRVFEDDATESFSRLGQAKNFLDLQEMAVGLMGRAMELGKKKVSPFEVFETYGGGLQEIRKRIGMTNETMAKELGISKASVSLLETGKMDRLSPEFGREQYAAFADVLRKNGGEKEKTRKAVNQ